MVAWILFLVVSTALSLLTGPADIYVASGIAVVIPYAVLLYFGLKTKPWAYLGISILSILLFLAVPLTIQEGMKELLWLSVVSTILLLLLALEGYKGYLQFEHPSSA